MAHDIQVLERGAHERAARLLAAAAALLFVVRFAGAIGSGNRPSSPSALNFALVWLIVVVAFVRTSGLVDRHRPGTPPPLALVHSAVLGVVLVPVGVLGTLLVQAWGRTSWLTAGVLGVVLTFVSGVRLGEPTQLAGPTADEVEYRSPAQPSHRGVSGLLAALWLPAGLALFYLASYCASDFGGTSAVFVPWWVLQIVGNVAAGFGLDRVPRRKSLSGGAGKVWLRCLAVSAAIFLVTVPALTLMPGPRADCG